MKRFPLGLLCGIIIGLILATSTIALAETTIRLIVKGNAITSDPPPMIYQDRVFVPVRFVSEALGYQVDWQEGTVSINNKTPESPKIIGSVEFTEKTSRALELLKEKAPESYYLVLNNFREIREVNNSSQNPTVAIAWTDAQNICFITTNLGYIPGGDEAIYRAITITHEAGHMVLYHSKTSNILTGADNEVPPDLFEYRTAQKLGASQELLDSLKKRIQGNLKF